MTEKNLKKSLREKINPDLEVEIIRDSKSLLHIENIHNKRKLRIHSCFIRAPEQIIEAIAQYITGKRKRYNRNKIIAFARRTFSTQLPECTETDYKGKFYNLKQIFDQLNKTYFNNSIKCDISFSRRFSGKRTRSIVFGNYNPGKNLIRINRALDSESVPEFFIRYIIFHEMLHAHIYLSGMNSSRHTKIFKKKENRYPELKLAEQWKKNNLGLFIHSHKEKNCVQKTQ